MSCGCNSNPCSCQPRPSVCCAPEQESVLYTFENGNLTGIGVFDNETDFLVQFRGLVSLSSSLTLALNATDNTIEIDFDDAALVADIPDATTTQRGILETATNAEALAKAATDKIVTPSNFAAMASTTTFAGLVELATNAETIAGVSTTLAVTPAGLASAGALTGTVTFADAVARGAAVPIFAGQFGGQVDTEQGFVAGSTAAGDWNGLLTFGVTSLMTGSTGVNLNGSSLTFLSGGVVFDGTTTNTMAGNLSVDNGTVLFTNMATVNFDPDTIFKFGGVNAGANTLFAFDSGGLSTDLAINTFLSTTNVQTGWAVTNPSVTRTLDVSSADLATTRAVLGTLINDLKAVLLPAT